jgi:Cytochrome P460
LAALNLSFPSPLRIGIFSLWSRTKKYAATGGWGFAQFNKDGKPADEAMHKTYFPCYEPAKAEDFVFTITHRDSQSHNLVLMLARSLEGNMEKLTYEKELTALLVIDPYNDFISEGGKVWDRLKGVAEANNCVPNMSQVLNAARKAGRFSFSMRCIIATVQATTRPGSTLRLSRRRPGRARPLKMARGEEQL